MAPILLKTPTSLTINSNYTADKERTFNIQCPDANLKNALVLNESEEPEFSLTRGPLLASWSVRRSLKDQTGQHILDIRHYKSKLSQWEIQSPQEKQICLIKDDKLPGMEITNATAQVTTGDVYATVSMRSSDHAGTTTVFEVENFPIAEMALTASNDVSFLQSRGLMRSAWILRVAAGADLALILALAFCRVEINHLWRR